MTNCLYLPSRIFPKNFGRQIIRFVLLAVILVSWSNASCLGQIKVELEEEVKVPFLGDWHNGVVTEINPKNKQEVMVEFIWNENFKTRKYKRREIRKMYEYEGLDYGRMWESANKKFKLEASLFKVISENEVELIKPDMEKVSVKLDQLCSRDNAYVNKFKKQFERNVRGGLIPDITPELPEIENFSGGGMSFGTMSEDEYGPLGAIPSFLKDFRQAGTGYNLIRKKQKLIAVVPVGGPDQLVLMSYRERNPFKSGERFQSQLYWVSLRQKKVVSYISITHEDYAIDYNPRYDLLLTFNRKEEFIGETDEPDNYTIWKMKPGGTKAEPIIRWQGEGLSWAKTLFGKIVNDRIVIVKTKSHTYEAFDFVAKKSLYTVKPKSFFDAPAVISHDRQHLICPEDKRVSVIDATTGDVSFTVPVADRHVSAANINDAGDKLAALTERNIYVWDLSSGSKEPKVYPAPLIGSPFTSRIEWIDDDHILGQSHRERILYRLSLELPIWSYKLDVWQYFLNRDPLKNMVVDGKFFYVARPDTWGTSMAIGAVSLPGPGVEETTKDIDRESLLLLKPGTPIALNLYKAQQRQAEIQQWLIEKIEANQWVYDPDAELVLVGEMGVGQTQTIKYQELGINGRTQTVSFRPHYSNLKIMRDDQIIWQTGTSTGAPSFIRGQNAQAEVNRYQAPRFNFFRDVKIDNKIIDPKYSRGFGVSQLGLRGIEVVSTTPPGREDDPLAAAMQADEDQRKAAEEEGKEKDPNESDENQPPGRNGR